MPVFIMKKSKIEKSLSSWINLNDALKLVTEEDCQVLIKAEKEGNARPTFLKRIHSRLNKIRAVRERKELK